jgi:hypothetical protein
LTFASPNTQNERNLIKIVQAISFRTNTYKLSILEENSVTNLDVRQGHEVFGDMDHKLVHESWSYVETIHNVIHVVSETKITTLQ